MEGPAEVLQNEIVSCAPSLVKRDGPPRRARKCVKRDQTRLQNEYGTFDHSLHKNFRQLLICVYTYISMQIHRLVHVYMYIKTCIHILIYIYM